MPQSRFARAFGLAFVAALLVLAETTLARAEVEAGAGLEDAQDAGVHERAVQALARAEREDAALDLARAVDGYEEALRLDPSVANALRARERIATIRARSEGELLPLAALERVRRDPRLATDPRAIDALVRMADGFPPGLVRVEAWVLGAEAYANRLERPADAVALWRHIIVDAHADEVTAAAAARSLVTYEIARGDLEAAEAVLGLAGPRVDDTLARDVRRVVRRHRIHLAAITLLALVSVLATAAIARAARAGRLALVFARARASSRLIVGYGAYIAVAGALLASGYEQGSTRPFLFLGAALVPLLFVARAWGAAGEASTRARALRATLCATTALAAAFLVLESVDVAYLEGLGL